MRVLLVHDFLDETGGAERIVHATKKILEEQGHSVLFYAPAGHGSFVGAFFSIGHYFSLAKEIRGFKPDIMHVHNMYRKVSPSVLIAAKHMNVPVVMTLHDFQIVCPKTSLVAGDLLQCKDGFGWRCFFSSCYPRKPLNRAYQGLKAMKLLLHRFIIRRTVGYFFSPSTCLMNWTMKNLRTDAVSLLPNFTVSEKGPEFTPPPGSALLFIGKLSEQKGADVLIEAIARVRRVIPEVRLKIAGDGPEERKLKELSSRLRMSDHITFTGRLSSREAMRAYDDALCVVIPSKYVENCSIAGIEAMSKGRVIIASRIGGLPDLVEENETGFLVRPNDPLELSEKIIYLMQNPALLSEMGKRARAKYERGFSKAAYSRRLLSLYERAIRGAL